MARGKGFGPLADYVHGLGLKFGIHIMRGIPREAAHRHLPVFGSMYCANEAADPSSICKWNPDMYGLREKLPGDGPDEASPGQAYYDSFHHRHVRRLGRGFHQMRRYLALFNLEPEMQELTFDLQEAEQFRGMDCADLELEELWDGERTGTEGTVLRSQVPGHGVKLFRLL